MLKLKLFVIFLLCSIFSMPILAEEGWVNAANSDDAVWDIKSGSLEEIKTKGGNAIVTVVGRISNKSTKRIDVSKWYVSLADFDRKMGKIVTLDIDGKYKYENEFVDSSGSIASAIAELICGAYQQRVTERATKGI